MKPHHHQLRRHFATKYTAKITSTSPTGRSLAAEVTPPPPLPSDPLGYNLPRRDLICKATQILLSTTPTTTLPDPFSDLSHYLQSLSIPLTPLEASLILKSLKNPTLAFKFFHFCPSLKNDPFIYNRLFLTLSRSSSPLRLEQTESLLDDMEKHGVKGSISTVNILIGFFGDLDRCVGLVKKWGLRFNAYSYKCLLQGYLRLRDCDKAFGVYLDMLRCGYSLDIFAFNMLLDALAKDQKVCVFCFFV